MTRGFPSLATTAGVGFLSFYPLHRRISVDLSNRSVTLPASGLDLHPTGDNWWGMEISTCVTGSNFNQSNNSGTGAATASLIIRESSHVQEILYSATTSGLAHNYIASSIGSNNYAYFFSFVVTQHSLAVRDACRQAMLSGQLTIDFAGEFKIEYDAGRAFTSATFPVTCHVPVIRPESF